MIDIQTILPLAEELYPGLKKISAFIHQNPELGMEEYQASAKAADFLERHGFAVTKNLAGLPTAFQAEKKIGNGNGPHFAFMAEYDALPDIGHACGHNLICVSGLAAGCLAAAFLEKLNHPGRISVFGTPGEEGKSGKVLMKQAGVFDDVDASLISHPYDISSTDDGAYAVARYKVAYYGKASHSGMAPEEGINALDAMISLYNGVSMWRQHFTEDVRVHGIITHGGTAVNIVPDYTEALFYLRSSDKKVQQKIEKRFQQIARGAAEQTGCSVDVIRMSANDPCLVNGPLNREYYQYWKQMGGEIRYAKGNEGRASTDYGDISQMMPGANLHFGICEKPGVPLHCREFQQAAGTDHAFQQAMKCAVIMAAVCLQYYEDPVFREEVHRDFTDRKKD